MHVRETGIAGLLVFEPSPHRDERGWFSRTFDADVARGAGVDPHAFLQDSQSRTVRAGLRGLHGRVGRGEAKLVRCARGAIFDVVVDMRHDAINAFAVLSSADRPIATAATPSPRPRVRCWRSMP